MTHRFLSYFRCTLCILATMCVTSIHADIIRGRVVDVSSDEGVSYAMVSYLYVSDPSIGMFQQGSVTTDSLGHFTFFSSGNGRLEASMVGYKDSKVIRFSAFSASRRDTVDLGIIQLQPTETLMRMLEVRSRARRFTIIGDTIVFHPEAFHLEEGTRLEELIRQLPGVNTNEGGGLTWNGRPLRVIMNGRELFGGNAIIGQLPAEAVKDIKAYNKASEFSERTKKKDGGEDMVLDVNIKPGFLDRFYGDATARYQPAEKYEGEVSANRLSDTDPLMLYAEGNNLNRHAGQNISSWSSSQREDGYSLGQFGAAGYQHNWGRQDGSQQLRSNAQVNAGFSHEDQWGTDYRETLNYFQDEVNNRRSEKSHHHGHQIKPELRTSTCWQTDTMNTFYADFSLIYGRQRDICSEEVMQYQTDNSLNAVSEDVLTMSDVNRSRSDGDVLEAGCNARWIHYIKDGSIAINAQWQLSDKDAKAHTRREVLYPWATMQDFAVEQDSHQRTNRHDGSVKAEAMRWLTPQVLLTADYTLQLVRENDQRDFMTNALPDETETYDDLCHSLTHSIGLSSTINLRPFQLIPSLRYSAMCEREAYRRGTLDTLARRRTLYPTPSFKARWQVNATSEADIEYGFMQFEPLLRQTLSYRDASNPIYVLEGNPELSSIHVNHCGIGYRTVLTSRQLQLYVRAGFHHADRAHSPFLRYDASHASYLMRLENVKGHNGGNFTANCDQGFGDIVRLSNYLYLAYTQSYAYLTQTCDDEALHLNRQRQAVWRDNISLSFDWKWLKAKAYGRIGMQHLVNTTAQVQNTTLWQNRFGLSAELRRGVFTVKTELYDLMRRGFSLSGMNTDRFIWNASAQWRCIKGKGRLSLEVDDILNNADNFTSAESPNQQVMTWSDMMHHYIRIGFTYHFDAKAKK